MTQNPIGNAPGTTHSPRATVQGALIADRAPFRSLRLAAAQGALEDHAVRLDPADRALQIPTATGALEAPCEVLAFGPFRFDRVQHVLRKSGKRLRIGGRSREILLALLERPGETLSKRELLKRVWAQGAVEEGTMRVHITALRRILGSDESGIEYVQNVPGRGYRFAARVAYVREVTSAPDTPLSSSGAPRVVESSPTAYRTRNFPGPPTRMLGRAKALRTLAARVPRQRLVTIAGPGGVGKTTLALHLADTLAASFPQGACLVELELLQEPRQVLGAVAAALDLVGLSAEPLPQILGFLRDKSMLVVLDNCEQVIEVAASLVETVLQSAPGVHFVATSREPLGAESESVHRLEPLAVPPGQPATAADALAFAAVQLFIECAQASCDSFECEDAQMHLIAEICRRLDGNPLAIKLAAECVNLLGVKGLAAGLNQGLHLVIEGRRTAVPRHQTLRAMFDWSYELLSHSQRATLRRLAVFSSSFDSLSASAVVADETVAGGEVVKCLASLAAKSLIAIDVTAEKVLYRLHNTPRAYALEKLRDSGELARTQRRHADLCRTLGTAELRAQPGMDGAAVVSRRIDEVGAALRWAFSPASEASVGTRLTLTSFWVELAFTERPSHTPGSLRNLALAQDGPGHSRRTAPWGVWLERLILRDHRVAIHISEVFRNRRGLSDAQSTTAQSATVRDQFLAVAHHYAGQQSLARRHAERVLHRPDTTGPEVASEVSQRCHARAMLARILWLQGFADQAVRLARENVSVAFVLSEQKPGLYCETLLTAVGIAMWCGNLEEAQGLLTEARRFLRELRRGPVGWSLQLHQLRTNCLDMALAVRRGEIEVEADLSDDPGSDPQYLDILGTYSEQLVSTCAIARAEAGRGGWHSAEVLRIKAERVLKALGSSGATQAEAQFQRALDTARRQDCLAWELRAAMSLARLWRDQHRPGPARDLLNAVYSRFSEGFGTADLVAARALLQEPAIG